MVNISFIAPADSPDKMQLPLFADLASCGFPSPALFPSGTGCQSQQPDRILNILSWLETGRECNQPLATLTIVSVLKALNSNGIIISIDDRARSPDGYLAP